MQKILAFTYLNSIQKTITQDLPWAESGYMTDYSSNDWRLMVIAVATVLFIHSARNYGLSSTGLHWGGCWANKIPHGPMQLPV